MTIKEYKKSEVVQISEHFSTSEFHCKCNYSDCDKTLISDELVCLLENIRAEVEKPVSLDCSYRCPKHNADVGGVPKSQHVLGLAADIRITGLTPMEVKEVVEKLVPNSGGIGVYDSFTHCDVRLNKSRWDFRKNK